ncbi:MAG: DUF2490 domain-containing protein [Saprospiraceae bacterium]|nr:DUF2490 domain-containing protein [Saprospiraceae bacterium]
MKYLAIFILCSLLLCVNVTSIQAQNRHDFGIWSGIKLNQKIYKNLSGSFRGQVRLEGNAAYFKSTFANFAFNYKFHKMFTLTAGYRYTIKTIRNNHRVYGDAKFTYRPEKLRTTFKLRLRGQYSTDNDQTNAPSTILRPRLYIGYQPKGKFGKKFNFYITGEIFYEFVESYNSLNKYRLSAGVTYDMNSDITLNLRYIYNDDIGIVEPIQENVLFIGLEVDLPKCKFKKKKKDED